MPPSNLARQARRKRQTKLTFDASEPSAATGGLKPAKVRYQALSSNWKKKSFGMGVRNSPFDQQLPSDSENLPSTSQLPVDDDNSSPPISQLPSFSRPLSDSDDTFSSGRNFAVLIESPPSQKKRTEARAFNFDGAMDSSDGSPPTAKRAKKSSAPVVIHDSESDDSLLESPPRAAIKRGKAVLSQDSTPQKENLSTKRDKTFNARSFITGGSSYIAPKATTPSKTPAKTAKRKNMEFIELSEDSENGSTDSDEEPVVPITPRQTQFSSARKKRRILSDDDDDDDDDDEPVLSSPMKTRKRFPRTIEDGNLPIREPKDKGKEKATTPKRLTRQQQPGRKPRTEKQKKLELLKRRKAGEKIDDVTDSESSDEEVVQRGIYDSDSEVEALSKFEDEEDDDGINEVREAIRAPNRNEYDEDFVVDDEEMPIGVPTHDVAEIPLEFTHAAHKPLKEHFKDAVEWLVQRKINPSFQRNDPIYKQAFRKVDDEVHVYASSKFTSSAWTKPFTRALWARPMFFMTELSLADQEARESRKCGACNRSKHTPSWTVQFGEHAYHKDTLEDVEKDRNSSSDSSSQPSDDDNDDSGNNSDNSSVDENGQSIPEQSKIWYVGRFCMANAETAHNLIHWKYALNTWVLDQLKKEGHLVAEKLAEREPWGEKKRSKYANRIVDGWERTGHINNLYKTFKQNVEKARDQKQTRFNT